MDSEVNTTAPKSSVDLSVVAPAQNEEDNIIPFLEDLGRAFEQSTISFEAIVVDDGSTDETRAKVQVAMRDKPWLRCITMTNRPPVTGDGKGAAYLAGFQVAQGRYIATIDTDRQNDPADLPLMYKRAVDEKAPMVQGDRSGKRKDNLIRKFSSKVGKAFRKMIIRDVVRDTSCGIRIIRKDVALKVPLQYRGMHRFIGYYVNLLGYKVIEIPVHHLPRTSGRAKYNMWNRAIPGLLDLLAVRWMTKRLQPVTYDTTESN
ncbi:MAG: glycosyltransferase family 2 protein [Myxococcota bacterium]|nr:glycosyltransferase family 2 protein [Myxococcota bacterium]